MIITKDAPDKKYKVLTDLEPLLRPIDSVHPDPANAREGHDISGIAASLNRYGQRKPIVVNSDGTIEAGNGTHAAAKSLDWTHIAVVGVDDDPVTAVGFSLVDNELGDKSRFNLERLHALTSALPEPENLPGFNLERLKEIRAMVGVDDDVAVGDVVDAESQIDKAEELQEQWGVAEGDIWQAGPHYVICGDCREPDTWRRLLAKSGHDKVNGVFTSPPYAEQRKAQYGGTPVDEYVEWWDAVQENVRGNLADDGSFFVNIKPHCKDGERVLYVFDLVLAMKRRWGWRYVDELCWKHSGTPGKFVKRFKNQFEPVYQFTTGEYKCFPERVAHYSDRAFRRQGKGSVAQMAGLPGGAIPGIDKMGGLAYPGNVVSVNVDNHGGSGSGHSGAFPVRLPDFFIKAYSDPGDVWLDPFLGSGTTTVAAHQADGGQRIGLGIEQLPKYVSVCLERFVKTLGLEPKLIANV